MSNLPKVLIIDDDPRMVESLRSLLRSQKYDIKTSNNTKEAIDCLEKNVIDLVLLDIYISDENGYKIMDHINSQNLDTLVIVLTGSASTETAIEALRKGAYDYLKKPFDPAELLTKVKNSLNQKMLKNDHKLAEKALLESREKYRELYHKAPNAYFSVRASDGSILNCNETAARLLGYVRETLLGMKFYDLYADTQCGLSKAKELFKCFMEGELIRDAELQMKNKAEHLVWISLSVDPVRDHDGNIIESRSMVIDITERKHLETQLLQAQKMEALGILAGGVAHDLNNVLSGLVTYPDLILMDLHEDNPLRNPILTIQKSGQKAASIVQDLLTLARRGVAITEVLNLNHMISEYLKSPEHKQLNSFDTGVKIETNLDINLLNIMGSPIHLSKTVMNLMSNAVEAMPYGGIMSISTENRYVDRPIRGYNDVAEGDYAVLTVSDAGIGISSEDMKRIFEPFYTKKMMGRSGTGLGMAVVWTAVKDHQGYIDVQSIEGKGTTFTLYFPVVRKELAKDESLLPIDDYMGKGESILIVDDVEGQREIASELLKKLGYSVTSVSSGERAIAYMKSNSVDLLVLDMIMDPGIDGLETYKKILEVHPNQKTVIVSGFSETSRVKEVQRLGGGAYVKKPYLLDKIGVTVRNELDKL